MKVLKEGTAHKTDIMEVKCNFCESEIRIISGDPRSYRSWSGFNGVEVTLKFICPVCGSRVKVSTHHDHHYDGLKLRKNVLLSIEDKKEMETWKDEKYEDLSDDDLMFINKTRPGKK